MKMKIFQCLAITSVLVGLSISAAVPEQEGEPAEQSNRAIVLPGSPLRNACQWQVNNNPCVNNQLQQLNFPHPTDSGKFIQCGMYERMFIVQCPAGEVYEQATATCVQPQIINNPQVVNLVSGSVSVCSVQNLQSGRIFFAVPGDSRQFIQCDQNGQARYLSCPGQLTWDQSRQSCVVYANGGAVANPASISGYLTGNSPCTAQAIAANTLFFSHPDPTKFIQCDLNGNAFVQRCPSGLVWNQYLETCASQLATFTLAGQSQLLYPNNQG
ncbi:uncharacterized protein LOC127881676 [Dreissena polymorpha]|nr:uncharacterized protein LOC127881676 [Dreissena polymorpha]